MVAFKSERHPHSCIRNGVELLNVIESTPVYCSWFVVGSGLEHMKTLWLWAAVARPLWWFMGTNSILVTCPLVTSVSLAALDSLKRIHTEEMVSVRLEMGDMFLLSWLPKLPRAQLLGFDNWSWWSYEKSGLVSPAVCTVLWTFFWDLYLVILLIPCKYSQRMQRVSPIFGELLHLECEADSSFL